ncbi:hypothetical protein C4572_03480 [Candidatus Parcubacteria bacterium]|nr:MAG: hypothetical protein C4572_03480 [Candidatus Parcubacteria bacterium]
MTKNKRENNKNRGIALLEAVVGVSVISLIIFSLLSVFHISQKVMTESGRNAKASFLLEEGIEAVRIMRDSSWSNIASLSTSTDYYFSFNGSAWATTTANVFVDSIFERKVRVGDVFRSGSDDIAASGTFDAGTKKITVTVSWPGRTGTSTKSISTYVANIF